MQVWGQPGLQSELVQGQPKLHGETLSQKRLGKKTDREKEKLITLRAPLNSTQPQDYPFPMLAIEKSLCSGEAGLEAPGIAQDDMEARSGESVFPAKKDLTLLSPQLPECWQQSHHPQAGN